MYIMTESLCKNIFPLNWFLVKNGAFAVRMHTERFFFIQWSEKTGELRDKSGNWELKTFQTKAHRAWRLGEILTITKADTVKMHINIVHQHEKLRIADNVL